MSRNGRYRLTPWLLLALGGCGSEVDPLVVIVGGELTAFGHNALSIEAPGAPAHALVTIGGHPAYAVGLDPDDPGRLLATPMGRPEPGPADIVITWDDGEIRHLGAVSFAAPIDPLFDRYAAFGASLTQGIQDGSLGPRGQLATAAAVIARQAGAFAGVPLVKADLLPMIEPSDLTADCDLKEGRGIPERFADALGRLTDPESGVLDLRTARVAPESETRNVGVGGSNLPDILHGAGEGSEPALAFMEHLAWDPETSNLFDTVSSSPELSQIEMIESIQPTIVVSLDMLDNELMDAVVRTDDPASAELPTAADLEAQTTELLARAAAASGQVFVGDVPPVSFLPQVRRRALRAGRTDLSHIDEGIQSINEMLRRVAQDHENVHVVPVNEMAQRALTDGIELSDGRRLTGDFLGGLLSLDHTHFSDTGYAVMANVFLDAIEEATGVAVQRVDIEEVARHDPRGPILLQPPPCAATAQRP